MLTSCAHFCATCSLSWYRVTNAFCFDHEIVTTAVNLFDRYILGIQRGLNSSELTAIAVACIVIGEKSRDRIRFSAPLLAQLCAVFGCEGEPTALEETVRAVHAAEESILQELEWRVNAPTMHQFAYQLYLLHPLSKLKCIEGGYLHSAARLQAERSIEHRELVGVYSPSAIAFAAMLRAEDMIKDSDVLTPKMTRKFLALGIAYMGLNPVVVESAVAALEMTGPIPSLIEYALLMAVPPTDDDNSVLPSAEPNVNTAVTPVHTPDLEDDALNDLYGSDPDEEEGGEDFQHDKPHGSSGVLLHDGSQA